MWMLATLRPANLLSALLVQPQFLFARITTLSTIEVSNQPVFSLCPQFCGLKNAMFLLVKSPKSHRLLRRQARTKHIPSLFPCPNRPWGSSCVRLPGQFSKAPPFPRRQIHTSYVPMVSRPATKIFVTSSSLTMLLLGPGNSESAFRLVTTATKEADLCHSLANFVRRICFSKKHIILTGAVPCDQGLLQWMRLLIETITSKRLRTELRGTT